MESACKYLSVENICQQKQELEAGISVKISVFEKYCAQKYMSVEYIFQQKIYISTEYLSVENICRQK